MKLRVFQSAEGDCLLLEGGGKRVLVDGGMAGAYTRHVAPALGELRKKRKALDVVYVSHIDQDHISGVLQMVDDLVEWRAFKFQRDSGNPRAKQPAVVEPPEIGAIWHNAFHEEVGDNAGEIRSLLAASAAVLSGTEQAAVLAVAWEHNQLATSVAEAIQLSRRVGDGQLNIPLNPEYDGRLMVVGGQGPAEIPVGRMRMTLLGPFVQDLEKLREEWNAWLRANRKRLEQIRDRAERDRERIGNDAGALVASARLQAEELARLAGLEALAARETRLGERRMVTTPNLASLMFLAEEGSQSILLTGDGHWEDILKGLREANRLRDGRLHVNVLKVQHHGSEHNIHADFCDSVTANHYVFCGNGSDENPNLRVVELIATQRFAGDDRPFKFWFNSHASVAESAARRAHMQDVERLVRRLGAADARLTFEFLQDDFFDIPVGSPRARRAPGR